MISLLLMILCGIFKSFMDISAHGKPFWFMPVQHWYYPKYNWWYMNQSAGWKWKNGKDKTDGEKFFGSSTFAVGLTDFWHLAQFFFLNTMIAAIVLYEPLINWWADFLIYGVVMKGTFQLFYGSLLVKK